MSKSEGNGVDPRRAGRALRRRHRAAVHHVRLAARADARVVRRGRAGRGALHPAPVDRGARARQRAGPAPPLRRGALSGAQRELRRAAHQALAKATDDIGRRRNFNTAIAAIMELLNAIGSVQRLEPAGARGAPGGARDRGAGARAHHSRTSCHALWQALGHPRALIDERWPAPDPHGAGAGHGRAGRAGQRQAARPYHRAGQLPDEAAVHAGRSPTSTCRSSCRTKAVRRVIVRARQARQRGGVMRSRSAFSETHRGRRRSGSAGRRLRLSSAGAHAAAGAGEDPVRRGTQTGRATSCRACGTRCCRTARSLAARRRRPRRSSASCKDRRHAARALGVGLNQPNRVRDHLHRALLGQRRRQGAAAAAGLVGDPRASASTSRSCSPRGTRRTCCARTWRTIWPTW